MSEPSQIEELAVMAHKNYKAYGPATISSIERALHELRDQLTSEHEKQVSELTQQTEKLKFWQSEHLRILDVSNEHFRYARAKVAHLLNDKEAGVDGICTELSELVANLKAQVAELTRKLAEAERQRDEDGEAFIARTQMGIEAVERLTSQLAESQAARLAAEEKTKMVNDTNASLFKSLIALEQVNGEMRGFLEKVSTYCPETLFPIDEAECKRLLNLQPSPELLPKIIQVLQDVRLQYPDDIEAVNQLLRTLTSTEVKGDR
jgi:hypothetical protein